MTWLALEVPHPKATVTALREASDGFDNAAHGMQAWQGRKYLREITKQIEQHQEARSAVAVVLVYRSAEAAQQAEENLGDVEDLLAKTAMGGRWDTVRMIRQTIAQQVPKPGPRLVSVHEERGCPPGDTDVDGVRYCDACGMFMGALRMVQS